jgi:hypothetical protein
MGSGEIRTPGWREASRVRHLAQGHLETVWVLVRFELLGGEKQVGLGILLRDTWETVWDQMRFELLVYIPSKTSHLESDGRRLS